jgi:hypothetical protein
MCNTYAEVLPALSVRLQYLGSTVPSLCTVSDFPSCGAFKIRRLPTQSFTGACAELYYLWTIQIGGSVAF